MASESSEMGLPPEAAAQASKVTAPTAENKSGLLSKLMFWKKISPAVQEGPIPGVTPASPDQLFNQSGPRVTLPEEQADIANKEVTSAQKVA